MKIKKGILAIMTPWKLGVWVLGAITAASVASKIRHRQQLIKVPDLPISSEPEIVVVSVTSPSPTTTAGFTILALEDESENSALTMHKLKYILDECDKFNILEDCDTHGRETVVTFSDHRANGEPCEVMFTFEEEDDDAVIGIGISPHHSVPPTEETRRHYIQVALGILFNRLPKDVQTSVMFNYRRSFN